MSACTLLPFWAACGGGTNIEEIAGPTSVTRCQIALDAPPASIPAAGSEFSVNVSTARECAWSVASDASWLVVSPTSGQGSAALKATVAANALGSARTSDVTVNDVRVSVTQQGVPCRFELGDPVATIEAAGKKQSVHISTVGGCDWRTSSAVEWIRVLTASGSGSATIDLDVGQNSGGERSAIVTIAGIAFRVVQEAASSAPRPAPQPPPCTITLEPGLSALPSEGGTYSLQVTADAGCEWTAQATVNWIAVLTRGGTGTGTVSYRLYPGGDRGRQGTIVVAGRVKHIYQYGTLD